MTATHREEASREDSRRMMYAAASCARWASRTARSALKSGEAEGRVCRGTRDSGLEEMPATMARCEGSDSSELKACCSSCEAVGAARLDREHSFRYAGVSWRGDLWGVVPVMPDCIAGECI